MPFRKKHATRSQKRAYGPAPTPTPANPYEQVEWIFANRMNRISNRNTRSNYLQALGFYKKYLVATKPGVPIFLNKELDEFALLRIRSYLDKNNRKGTPDYLTSNTVVTLFSGLRNVFREAALHGYAAAQTILNVAVSGATSETDAHNAYSDFENDQITHAMALECVFVASVRGGYTHLESSIGRDPRVSLREDCKSRHGWRVEANMRWYFEHVLNCEPVTYQNGISKHMSFLRSSTNYHGGLHELYRKWGVTAYLDEWLICPLLVKLLALTGINPASALSLDMDCYSDSHPLTNAPYLVLEKLRSGGELGIHLPLLDGVEAIPLKQKQSYLVRKVIEEIKDITSPLRNPAAVSEELRRKLFVYQSSSSKTCGEIKQLTKRQTSRWCRAIVRKHLLKRADGTPLTFNLVRYRPTLLTQMALDGHDLFEIQQVARHKNIRQTVAYIDRNKLDSRAHRTISAALRTIHENRKAHNEGQVARIEPRLFKGLVADCLNVFDPPEQVKRSLEYVPGHPCVRHNMCLFCRNVIIFREHLPALVAYRSQLVVAFSGDLKQAPYFRHYENTLAVLDELLDPETSEFSAEDIAWAEDQALSLDILVDTSIYRASEQQ